MKSQDRMTELRLSYERLLRPKWPNLELSQLATPELLTDEEAAIFGEIGKSYLHFFAVFVCGFDLMTPLEGFHGTVCERMETIERPQLHLYYRGAYKTTLGHIARPLWKAARDPEHYDHITLVSDLELGKQQLRAIGNQIEHNQVMRRLYPELRPNRKDWSDKSRSLASRDVTKMGPTFELRSIEQSLSGRHRHSMGIDDLVNDRNYSSREIQDHLKERFDYIWPTVDTDELLLTATPYADYDATMHIIRELWPEELDVFVQPVRGSGWLDAKGKVVLEDDGVYADPGKWNDEALRRVQRKISNPYVFRCQYFLDTTQPDALGFQREWWQSRVRLDELPELSIYIAVDPASGKGTSRPAIAVVGIDTKGNIYILAVFSAYKSEAALVEGIFAAALAHKPVMVGIERYGQGGYSIFELVERQCRRRKIYLPLTPMTEPSKEQRIPEVLRPLYEWGTIFHVEGLKGGEYETELALFPGGQYQDETDVVSLAVILAQRLGFRRRVEKRRQPRRPLPPGVTRSRTLAGHMQHDLFDEDEDRVVTSW